MKKVFIRYKWFKTICKSYRNGNDQYFWNEKRNNRVKSLPLLTRVGSKWRHWTRNTPPLLTIGEGVPLVTLNYNKNPETKFEFSYDTTLIVKATKNFRLKKHVWWREELNKNALFISHSILSFASSDN